MRRWREVSLRFLVAGALVVSGCGAATPSQESPSPTTAQSTPTQRPTETSTQVPAPETARPTETARSTPTATTTAAAFPTEAFAAIADNPVSAELAAELQSILEDHAGEAGVSATVMSASGTWSGATGTADGVRNVTVNDQFSIASITKALTAAQVMQLVEAGELGLDDLAADHLPADLDFDANGATIRDLLGQRSGIPDYRLDAEQIDPLVQWTPAELLATVPADRTPAGEAFEYGNVNYLLLGLVIAEVTGRGVAEVMRGGVLGIDGVDRLIYQPDEMPSEPIAMEHGQSTDMLDSVGGFLPSLALTSDGAAAAMASDSVSLARWWRAFCAGEIVSEASLTAMTTMHDGYGFGLYHPEDPPGAVGHSGLDRGYNAMAGCVPASGVAFAVLTNRNQDVVDASEVADFLVRAL